MSAKLVRVFIHSILMVVFFSCTAAVWAEEGDINSLLEYVEKRLADKNAMQQAVEDGEERTLLCKYCHGSDGNSLQPDVPNLAGQNAKYLLEQIDNFSTRKRDDFVMSDLASRFTPEDKVNVAIFYHTQAVKPQQVDKVKAEKGKTLYYTVCTHCHGIEGYGNNKLARLAGQQITYVIKVLKNFRNNANDPAVRKASQRKSEIMEGVAKILSDEQIESVANYAASMR